MTSQGKLSSTSHFAARGMTSRAQKSRTVFCNTSWSSLRLKFMCSLGGRRIGGSRPGELLLGAGGGEDLQHHGVPAAGELQIVRLIGRQVHGGGGAERGGLAAHRQLAAPLEHIQDLAGPGVAVPG